jgi:Fe-S cluster assembly protein SufD
MNTITETLDIKEKFVQEFEATLNNDAPNFIKSIREEAIKSFEQLGFPTTKMEYWKYTNVKPILEHSYKAANKNQTINLTKEELNKYLIAGYDSTLLVFFNGCFFKEYSQTNNLPAGVIIDSLINQQNNPLFQKHYAQIVDYTKEAFTAMNTAFANDGAFIFIPEKTVIPQAIHILYLTDSIDGNVISFPRNLIIVSQSSQVQIVESYHSISNQLSFTNAVTELIAYENAIIDYYKIQDENNASFQINNTQIKQERNSNVSSNTITLDGALVRNNLNYLINGEGCETHLFGLYLLNGKQHVDNHTLVDHAVPHCLSNELYKGIMKDQSSGVFNGRIMVRKDAQKTNAFQSNKNILLSDNAHVTTKPQLEIFADDVKCSHGATTGQLDQEALFYLRSRGIAKDKAMALLVHAFASDVIDKVKIDKLKINLLHLISERLNHHFD